MSALQCRCCSDWVVSWNFVGSISCAWCRHEMAAEEAAVLPWLTHQVQQAVYFCRQCTTCVRCGRCLSQFQICVCVSGLARPLSVSKFSLRQSVSTWTVTKSLSSPADASCQSEKKREQLYVHILKSLENPAVDLHWDTPEISISQLLKGRVKQCRFSSESIRYAALIQAFVPVDIS